MLKRFTDKTGIDKIKNSLSREDLNILSEITHAPSPKLQEIIDSLQHKDEVAQRNITDKLVKDYEKSTAHVMNLISRLSPYAQALFTGVTQPEIQKIKAMLDPKANI
jgi:hypothetical protein